jgi:hypothetical protein
MGQLKGPAALRDGALYLRAAAPPRRLVDDLKRPSVLEHIWTTDPETANRVRGRIRGARRDFPC